MKLRFIAALMLIPLCVQAGNVKIDALVKTFEGHSLWGGSSFWPKLDLPAEATPAQILDRLLTTGMPRFTSYQIIASETVQLVTDHVPVRPDGTPERPLVKEPVTAVLIKTNLGEKIVFMHYGKGPDWRTTIYDVK